MKGARKEILILDQDENVLIELERLLQDEGFETTTTWSVKEALHLLAVKEFDLFLLSDHLPEVSCSELLKMPASRETVPMSIVMQTRAVYPLEAQHLCRLGAYAVIPKWTRGDLLAKIQECLNAAENSLPQQGTAA